MSSLPARTAPALVAALALCVLVSACSPEAPAPVAVVTPVVGEVMALEVPAAALPLPAPPAAAPVSVAALRSLRDGVSSASPSEDAAADGGFRHLRESSAAVAAPDVDADALAGLIADNAVGSSRRHLGSRGPASLDGTSAGIVTFHRGSTGSTAAVAGFNASRPRAPGPLEADEIRQGIRRQMPRVRACYERALKKEEGLGGRMVASFDIAASGAVRGASLSMDEIGEEQLRRCVVDAVERWRFRASDGATAVDYTFLLHPARGLVER